MENSKLLFSKIWCKKYYESQNFGNFATFIIIYVFSRWYQPEVNLCIAINNPRRLGSVTTQVASWRRGRRSGTARSPKRGEKGQICSWEDSCFCVYIILRTKIILHTQLFPPKVLYILRKRSIFFTTNILHTIIKYEVHIVIRKIRFARLNHQPHARIREFGNLRCNAYIACYAQTHTPAHDFKPCTVYRPADDRCFYHGCKVRCASSCRHKMRLVWPRVWKEYFSCQQSNIYIYICVREQIYITADMGGAYGRLKNASSVSVLNGTFLHAYTCVMSVYCANSLIEPTLSRNWAKNQEATS